MPKQQPPPPTGEVILYQTEDGRARVECRFAGETVWLTQALMADLFGKDVRTINEHLQNLFEDGELDPGATIRKFRIVRIEGDREVTRGNAVRQGSVREHDERCRSNERDNEHQNNSPSFCRQFFCRSSSLRG